MELVACSDLLWLPLILEVPRKQGLIGGFLYLPHSTVHVFVCFFALVWYLLSIPGLITGCASFATFSDAFTF